MNKFKNSLRFLLPSIVAIALFIGVAFAANSFPTTLNSWSSGDTIEASWANALESKIGADSSAVTSSHDYLIKSTSSILGKIASLATTSGGILLADGTNWSLETNNATTGSTMTGIFNGGNITSAGTAALATTTSTGLTMSGNIVMGDNNITGINDITFTDTAGEIAGIPSGELLGSADAETISGQYTFTNENTFFQRNNVVNIVAKAYRATNPRLNISAHGARGTEAIPTAVANNDTLLYIYAFGYDGTTPQIASIIEFEIDGTPDENDMPGRIKFLTTADGTTTVSEAMRINNAGIVTKALQPAARAYLNAVTDNATGTWTLIPLNTENFDVNADFNTASSSFEAPVAGKYQVNGCIKITTTEDGKLYSIGIYKDSVLHAVNHTIAYSTPYRSICVSDLVSCTTGQEITLRYLTDAIATTTLGGATDQTFMSVNLVQ